MRTSSSHSPRRWTRPRPSSTRPSGLPGRPRTCADTDAERALLEEILTRCATAGAHLDALAPRFDELRDLDGRVGEVLTHLAGDLTTLEDRLSDATDIVGTLRTQFPRATIAGVVDDLDQASERLAFAQASITTGEELLASSDRLGAAARARAAEEALVQSSTLLDSVDRSPKVLARAQEAVTTLLRQTEKDIAEAESLGVADDLAAKGQYARETLGWAADEVSAGGYDPLEMRRALQDTDVALGRALGPIRPDDDTQERALSLLATAWYGARAAIRAADELIMTRRAAVGVEARVRLCEARGHHTTGTALGDSDPPAALRHLRTADALAYQARTLAQQDEAAWRNTRRMAAGIGELDSELLGGILIEAPAPGWRGDDCRPEPSPSTAARTAQLRRPCHPGAARRAWALPGRLKPAAGTRAGRSSRSRVDGSDPAEDSIRIGRIQVTHVDCWARLRPGERAHIVRHARGQAQPTSLSITSSALAKTTAAAV